jgi:hypothetical protein
METTTAIVKKHNSQTSEPKIVKFHEQKDEGNIYKFGVQGFGQFGL